MLVVMSFRAAGAVFADPTLPEGCFKERGTIYCTEQGKDPKLSEENSKEGSFRFSHPAQEEYDRLGQTGKGPRGSSSSLKTGLVEEGSELVG